MTVRDTNVCRPSIAPTACMSVCSALWGRRRHQLCTCRRSANWPTGTILSLRVSKRGSNLRTQLLCIPQPRFRAILRVVVGFSGSCLSGWEEDRRTAPEQCSFTTNGNKSLRTWHVRTLIFLHHGASPSTDNGTVGVGSWPINIGMITNHRYGDIKRRSDRRLLLEYLKLILLHIHDVMERRR